MYSFTFNETEIKIHNSWSPLFSSMASEIIDIGKQIESKSDYTPSAKNIFRVFEQSTGSVKIILLGQDPYPQKNIATGRAFEPSNYLDWNTTTKNTSILNILKELYVEHNGLVTTNIKTVRAAITEKKFIISPPSEIFSKWESNGVFLLNTSLTCEINNPNSHKLFWQCFTKKTIEFIANLNQNKHWLLFGDEAKSFEPLVKHYSKRNVLTLSPHPTNTSFVGSEAFKGVIQFFM